MILDTRNGEHPAAGGSGMNTNAVERTSESQESIFDVKLRSCTDSEECVNRQRPTFDCMFSPRSVAVVGATDREGSVGRTLLLNLANRDFRGAVNAVNPKRETVLGL